MANTMRVQKREEERKSTGVPPSSVIMSLNGQPMELIPSRFAIMTASFQIRGRARASIGLEDKAAAETLHLRPAANQTAAKIDATFSPVEYSFDFEKDKQYEKWSKSYSKFKKR